MKTVFLSEENRRWWDEFCLACDEAWFWHTSHWLEFLAAMKASHNNGIIEKENAFSRSFFVTDHNNSLVAIVPLIFVTEPDGATLSLDPLPGIAVRNDIPFNERNDVLQFIFDQIDAIARELRAVKITYQTYESFKSPNTFNYYLDYGFISYLYSTLVLDLNGDIEELWIGIRRNHKRHIKKLEVYNPYFKIYDSDCINKDTFEKYKQLHHEDAGRITRPDLTFAMMFEMVKRGNAVLLELSQGEDISFYYFIVYKQYAYSASICERKVRHASLRPKLEWEAIKYFKSRDCRYYELGMDFRSSLYKIYSEKEKNISGFKEGFSSNKFNLVLCEKYYDHRYMKKTLTDRVRAFINFYSHSQ